MLPFYTYDVFTGQRYAGNPLAIVHEAESLSTTQMQTIAREFNLSETMFVMPPKDPAHDAKVRIFFPTAEIPFAGHPTLGCALHLAERKMAANATSTTVILEEEAGIVPVEVTREEGRLTGWFAAPVLPERSEITLETATIAAACGLAVDQIGWAGHVPAIGQGGPSFIYVPVRDLEALSAVRALEPGWSDLTQACGTGGVYFYTKGHGDTDIQARMLAPTDGIPEDPATGSATAILAAQLLAAGDVTEGDTELRLLQGREMGRPSDLGLKITVQDGEIRQVRVGGTAVSMNEGRLVPPDSGD